MSLADPLKICCHRQQSFLQYYSRLPDGEGGDGSGYPHAGVVRNLLSGRGGSIASHQHVETASSVSAGLGEYVRQLVTPPSPVCPSYVQRN